MCLWSRALVWGLRGGTWMRPMTITQPQNSRIPRWFSGNVAISENWAQKVQSEDSAPANCTISTASLSESWACRLSGGSWTSSPWALLGPVPEQRLLTWDGAPGSLRSLETPWHSSQEQGCLLCRLGKKYQTWYLVPTLAPNHILVFKWIASFLPSPLW